MTLDTVFSYRDIKKVDRFDYNIKNMRMTKDIT